MSTLQSLSQPPRANYEEDRKATGGARILKYFAVLAAVSFLLRIFYSGHLCQDDGFWFTAGEEILRGKALYREIYFDKPPALPFVYGFLFWIFGAHIIVIRVFTILYSVLVSAVLYLFGSRLYGRRAGMLAAAMFTLFSTTSVNNHEQGLNTDVLMILPYTASAYFFVRACFEKRASLALVGGALTGLAAQVNPKGAFGLVFFSVLLVLAQRWRARNGIDFATPVEATSDAPRRRLRSPMIHLALGALAGFAGGTLPFIVYLLATRSFSDYWRFVWEWGSRYAAYFPAWTVIGRGAWLTAVFFARNNALLFGLVFVAVVLARSLAGNISWTRRVTWISNWIGQGDHTGSAHVLRSDVTLLIWFSVSYIALTIGGRFYSNYFFQILPSLCLIGGRGLIGIHAALKKHKRVRRAAIALVAAGVVITLIRSHTRTVQLALDVARGTRSGSNVEWYHEKLNRDERMVAAAVRDLPDTADTASPLAAEALRADSPRTRGATRESDYLFVWGSRAEIYYWSGLLPVSRYLSTQPLTGVPADVHHAAASRPITDESVNAAARIELLRDLEQTRPKYIVDELGFFSTELSIESYPEFREFLRDYKNIGTTGEFIIYRNREQRRRDRLTNKP